MVKIDWEHEVEKRKEALIEKTRELLKIKSVLDEDDGGPDAPLGRGVKEALQYMLDLGREDGFRVKNVGNLAGHIEFGAGKELVGILCHVDVVPAGDGWSCDPFGAEIRDGKIFARGAIDDKGPTMAAYFAMKIVKELELTLNKRVRMIIGTDEESDWRCVEHYFAREEMPTLGFAPDADFPIIYAEKGIMDFDFVQKPDNGPAQKEGAEVIRFASGRRYNMVPDFAAVVLKAPGEEEMLKRRFHEFLAVTNSTGRCFEAGGEVIFELEGISAHGMEPDRGKNAGLMLSSFLAKLHLDAEAQRFFPFIAQYFLDDSRGRKTGIAYADHTGEVTVNVGILTYDAGRGGKLGINLRYPVTADFSELKRKLQELAEKNGFAMENISNSNPHYVDENEFLVRTLKKVYEERTGEKAELLAIGGGTYARSLKSGVAFGPLFPGRPDVAHQKAEYIFIDDLLKATAIYAHAIYELAGQKTADR